MNQSLIINDDVHYDNSFQAWCFTALLNGQLLTVVLSDQINPNLNVDQSLKFDWEGRLEDWIEDNDIEQSTIYL
ncbi:hypothetical protein [Thalassotalea ganghwensis]